MCNTCNTNPCCCEKVISKQGLRGARGPQGATGPAGPSNVFVVSTVVDFDYTAAAYETIATYTVATAGNYLVMYEGDFRHAAGVLINYEMRKNGVQVANTARESKVDVSATPVYAKGAINAGLLLLSVGDIITVAMQSASNAQANGRSLTLIKVSNLTLS
jgi:hypothetical protein